MWFRRRHPVLIALIVLVSALAGAFAWYLRGERRVPAGQPALQALAPGQLEALRHDFNAHADKVRIVVLLSPT